MNTAVIQMRSTPRVDENFTQARALISQAAQAGAELIALPEYFCLMGMHDTDKLHIAEPLADVERRLLVATSEHRLLEGASFGGGKKIRQFALTGQNRVLVEWWEANGVRGEKRPGKSSLDQKWPRL